MSLGDQMLFVEKYRPHKIEDCIIPQTLKDSFQEFVNTKEIPNLLLTGSPGTGKTTVARALCEEVGADYIVINGSDDNGIDTLRVKVKGFASAVSLTGGRKVIIIDEADYLTPQAQAAFRGVIEEFIGNCSFIFTCNFKNRIIPALHSRCSVIDFKLTGTDKQQMAVAFFKRVSFILKTEKVTFKPEAVQQLMLRYLPDYRRILNELQRYGKTGTIDEGVLSKSNNAKFDELLAAIKKKDFNAIRKWAGANSDADPTSLMREVYDNMSNYFTPATIPAVVVITGKYLAQIPLCADQEINVAAWLTELMVEAEVK